MEKETEKVKIDKNYLKTGEKKKLQKNLKNRSNLF
jgi:hypothetical protein